MKTTMPVTPAQIGCPPPSIISAVQFYTIEIGQCADGRLSVGVQATICEEDGVLDAMDLGHAYVATRDQALDMIRPALGFQLCGRKQ